MDKRKESLVNLLFLSVRLNGKCGHSQIQEKQGKRDVSQLEEG